MPHFFRTTNVSGDGSIASIGRTLRNSLEDVLEMGSAGDSPAPGGDSPTGTPEGTMAERPLTLVRNAASILSGESPDRTGESPVLPRDLSNRFLESSIARKGRAQRAA